MLEVFNVNTSTKHVFSHLKNDMKTINYIFEPKMILKVPIDAMDNAILNFVNDDTNSTNLLLGVDLRLTQALANY